MEAVGFSIIPPVSDGKYDGWHRVLVAGTIKNGDKTFTFTKKDLEHFATTQVTNIVPFIDKDHQQEERYGDIIRYRIKENALEAYIVWNVLGKEVRDKGTYKYFSPTIENRYDNIDKKEKRTITSVSLTNSPAIGQLGEIQASKFNYNQGVIKMETIDQMLTAIKSAMAGMDDESKMKLMEGIKGMMGEMVKPSAMGGSESKEGYQTEKKDFQEDETTVSKFQQFMKIFKMWEKDTQKDDKKMEDNKNAEMAEKKDFSATAAATEASSKLKEITEEFGKLKGAYDKMGAELEALKAQNASFSAVQKGVNAGKIPADARFRNAFSALFEGMKEEEVTKIMEQLPQGSDSEKLSVDGAKQSTEESAGDAWFSQAMNKAKGATSTEKYANDKQTTTTKKV